MKLHKYKKAAVAYYLDVDRWDNRIVNGNIYRVHVEEIESEYPNSEFQQLIVRVIGSRDRFTTSNCMLYKTREDAEDALYIELERTRSYASDMLDRVRLAEKELKEAT